VTCEGISTPGTTEADAVASGAADPHDRQDVGDALFLEGTDLRTRRHVDLNPVHPLIPRCRTG
jgi:hypothetical protein